MKLLLCPAFVARDHATVKIVFFLTVSVDEMIAEVDIDGDGRIDYDGMLFYFTSYKGTA